MLSGKRLRAPDAARQRCSAMLGSIVTGADGVIGAVRGFYFSDRDWTVRYLLLETNAWFDRRHVVIPSSSIVRRDWRAGIVVVGYLREQVKASPRVDSARPLFHRQERRVRQYYEVPHASGGEWRNVRDMIGFRLQSDGDGAGRVGDILIDDAGWKVAGLLVDSGAGLPDPRRLVAPEWITEVRWTAAQIELRLDAFKVRPAGTGTTRRKHYAP